MSSRKIVSSYTNGMQIDDSDLFYRSLFEHNSDGVFFVDPEGVIAKTNDVLPEIVGYSINEIELYTLEQFLFQSEIALYKETFTRVMHGEPQYMETLFLHKDGEINQIHLTMIPAKNDGHVIGAFGIATDITEIKKTEIEFIESELKFRSVVEESLVGVYMIQNDQFIYGNPKLCTTLGLNQPPIGLEIWEFIHADDKPKIESVFDNLIDGEDGVTYYFRIINKDGSQIDVEAHSKRIFYQNKSTIIGMLQDITQRKKAEELNKFLAYHDELTELPNRRFFNESLEKELVICKTLNQKMAVMYLDLDRFKNINDSLGHTMGDKLLKAIAARMKVNLWEGHTFARISGDEFGILFPKSPNINKIIDHSKKIIELLEEPFFIENYKLFITTSIGISVYPTDGEDAETLIKHADSALYKAKEKGKNTIQIYTSSMDAETYKTFKLESDLRDAIGLNQLEYYYQPKVCSDTNRIVGAEALIRWNHPEWGILSPHEFLPIAEETRLIDEIGKKLNHVACAQNKAWQDAGLPPIPVSINLSAQRFSDKNLVTNIKQTLKETRLDPEYLEIEITETSLLKNEVSVISVLDELRSMGIRISLDDFGTGYSSFSYLNRFKDHIDILKIDRLFIDDISKEDSNDSNFITKTIIQLAQHYKLDVVAEGVENTMQLQQLKKYKCKIIQGFLYSKPVSAADFTVLLQKGKIDIPESDAGENRKPDEERRKLFRVDLEFPLQTTMTLIRIKGKKVDLGKTDVLIEDIGLGGIRFLSDLSLTVHRDIILEFETEILGENVTLHGVIVWSN